MSRDLCAYRASDELAAALRDHAEADREFIDTVVLPFDRENAGHEVMWARSPFSADYHAMGFRDGTDAVPDGLSRAKSRTSLKPMRGEPGKPWRTQLARMRRRPQVEAVYRRFDVRTCGDGPPTGRGSFWTAPTLFFDAGTDGVLVHCDYDLTRRYDGEHLALSPHLTVMPLSEFYAARERVDAERAAAAGAS